MRKRGEVGQQEILWASGEVSSDCVEDSERGRHKLVSIWTIGQVMLE